LLRVVPELVAPSVSAAPAGMSVAARMIPRLVISSQATAGRVESTRATGRAATAPMTIASTTPGTNHGNISGA
jgi:hypothetical protein